MKSQSNTKERIESALDIARDLERRVRVARKIAANIKSKNELESELWEEYRLRIPGADDEFNRIVLFNERIGIGKDIVRNAYINSKIHKRWEKNHGKNYIGGIVKDFDEFRMLTLIAEKTGDALASRICEYISQKYELPDWEVEVCAFNAAGVDISRKLISRSMTCEQYEDLLYGRQNFAYHVPKSEAIYLPQKSQPSKVA